MLLDFNYSENNRVIDVKDTVMSDILKPRKRVLRFGDYTDKLKRKSARVYYIIKDKISVYINNIINHRINNPILIFIFYRSAVDDSIYGAIWKKAI